MSVHTSMLMERNDLELLGYLNFRSIWREIVGQIGTIQYISTHIRIYIYAYVYIFALFQAPANV